MTFYSILFAKPEDHIKEATVAAPGFFVDLNLDQIIAAVTANKKEYDLNRFFYAPLQDVEAINYRQEIVRDLENETFLEQINAFAETMRVMRRYLALTGKLHYRYHKQGWFLEVVDTYCSAVNGLVDDLHHARLQSRGLLAFREYLTAYAGSGAFTSLSAEIKELKAALCRVKYSMIIKDSTVRVRKYQGEADYSIEVENTFEKFKQGAVKDYRLKLVIGSGMNHVEAQILDLVAKLHPEIFAALDNFCRQHSNFLDDTILVFDREIQFYVSYLEYTTRLKRAGLRFCYPAICRQNKEIFSHDGFDLALATKLVGEGSSIVCNDFYLKGKERVLVVSGPNQGGKTTFARTFGQLHYLASLGFPVPGKTSQLFLFDRLYTHFEREESITNLRGKLQDDLVRIHTIFDEATPNSILVLNEIFSSTTLEDEVFLSKEMMARILQLDLLCVWVTFVDELASFSEKTVSMVSTVVPENPALRTFKIIRKPADGLAYAIFIAEKYGLTYERIKERIRS